jgi:hypothetical protein
MMKMVSELNEKVSRLESVISQKNVLPLSQRQSGEKSYAGALKSDNSEKKIIIKSKENNDNEDFVRDKLAQTVDPVTAQISSFVRLRDHSCVVKSKSQNTEKLVSDIRENLGDDYEVEIVEKKNPKIKIVGYNSDAEMSHVDIVKALKIQNGLVLSSDEEIKIVKEIKSRTNERQSSFVVSVNSELHKMLIEKKHVTIGYTSCRVYDATIAPRCYKCSRLGHFDNNNCCENDLCCPKCCGDHKLSECTNNVLKCINCSESNEKHRTKYDTNHAAFDRKCPTMLKRLAAMKKSRNK